MRELPFSLEGGSRTLTGWLKDTLTYEKETDLNALISHFSDCSDLLCVSEAGKFPAGSELLSQACQRSPSGCFELMDLLASFAIFMAFCSALIGVSFAEFINNQRN